MSDFETRVSELTTGTYARIDLDAYARNIARLRALTPPDTAFMAVVKADGYGHGAAQCGLAAQSAGVDYLGVARIHEALYLRQHGVTAPILVLGPPSQGDIAAAIDAHITLTVGTEASLNAVAGVARDRGRTATVHLKLDTGMRRYGFLPTEIVDAAQRAAMSPHLVLEGMFTHFSSADDLVDEITPGQLAEYDRAASDIARVGIEFRFRHTANSAATLRGTLGQSNMVRSGIATYGLSPSAEVPVSAEFEPILSIHSRVARRLLVSPGDGVSYNRTFVANCPTHAADVPIGYADGLPRNVSNHGWYVIHGERCPIIGRVCMDQSIVAVPQSVNEGDDVLILGPGTQGDMTFEDAGALAGTNNYEVATRLTARLPRVYVRNGVPVAFEHLLLNDRGVWDCASASQT